MKRAIVVALDLNPDIGSECGNAHQWARIIARHYHVDVFVPAWHQGGIVRSLSAYPLATFHFMFPNAAVQGVLQRLRPPNVRNAVFVHVVKRTLQRADLREYRLIHVLTPAGVHSFNSLYTLGIPVIVGPLGGALPSHPAFRDTFKDEWLRNLLRDTFYRLVVHLPSWRRYFLNANTLLAGTDCVTQFLPEECRGKSQVVFDTFVDTDVYKPPTERRPTKSTVRVLFAGTLSASKGPMLLVEAVRLCRARGVQGLDVVLFGDGPLRERLQRLVEESGLCDCVTLRGRVPTRELVEQYQKSDVFCLPTLREPGGGAILEAMACGLPVITSDYGGPRYSVTDDCGIRIEMVNPGQYARDLSSALELLVRREDLRRSMGHRARQRALENFSLQALDRRIQDIYRDYMA